MSRSKFDLLGDMTDLDRRSPIRCAAHEAEMCSTLDMPAGPRLRANPARSRHGELRRLALFDGYRHGVG